MTQPRRPVVRSVMWDQTGELPGLKQSSRIVWPGPLWPIAVQLVDGPVRMRLPVLGTTLPSATRQLLSAHALGEALASGGAAAISAPSTRATPVAANFALLLTASLLAMGMSPRTAPRRHSDHQVNQQ